jgi:hypothetical protein
VARGANLVSGLGRGLLDHHLEPVGHHRLVIDDEYPIPLAASCILGIHAFSLDHLNL